MKENLRLRKELEEAKKGKFVPKIKLCQRSWHCILCKGNQLVAYRFIQTHHKLFGLRWLLRRLMIFHNAYYNYLKNRKADYIKVKIATCAAISNIYHEYDGVPRYRSMRVFLERKNIYLSNSTIHKYMNKELGLYSIVKCKKPGYHKGKAHKTFANLLNQDFTAASIN